MHCYHFEIMKTVNSILSVGNKSRNKKVQLSYDSLSSVFKNYRNNFQKLVRMEVNYCAHSSSQLLWLKTAPGDLYIWVD